jgi:hypothetical protein
MNMQIFALIFLILLPLPVSAETFDIPSWPQARAVIESCYSGYDIEVSINGGYEHRIYESGPIDGEFANALVTIPLYSRKERLARQESTNQQIEHVAEIYAEYEESSATVAALEEEKRVLQKTMIDTGAQGISAYFDLIKNVEKSRAKKNSSARKIRAILENCGLPVERG